MNSRMAAAKSVRDRFRNGDKERPKRVVTHIAMFRDEYEAVKGQARIEALEDAKRLAGADAKRLIDKEIKRSKSECHQRRLKVADRWEGYIPRKRTWTDLLDDAKWTLLYRNFSSWWFAPIIAGLLIAAYLKG